MSIVSTKFSPQGSQEQSYNQEGSAVSDSTQRRFTITALLNYE